MRTRFTPRAARQLDSALAYIKERSPQGAHHVQSRIQDVIRLLEDYPNVGQLTNQPNIRRVVTSPYPYAIFYEVGETEIVIHAVRHAARRPIV